MYFFKIIKKKIKILNLLVMNFWIARKIIFFLLNINKILKISFHQNCIIIQIINNNNFYLASMIKLVFNKIISNNSIINLSLNCIIILKNIMIITIMKNMKITILTLIQIIILKWAKKKTNLTTIQINMMFMKIILYKNLTKIT